MKRKLIFIVGSLIFIVFINLRCDSLDQYNDLKSSNDTMRISIKQTCYNDKYNIKLRFDSVLNDSRCPFGAECFWEGNVQVKFTLIDENKILHDLYLNSSSIFRIDTTIKGINYKLIEVVPHPVIDSNIDNSSYKATVLATTK